jgi:hypothetical protein
MSNKPSLPPVPPLSFEALREVGVIEDYVQDALWDCGDNPEKTIRILRTGVVESLNVQMDYYSSLPTYHSVWNLEVAGKTIDALIALSPPLTPGEQFRGELLRTAVAHLIQRLGAAKNKAATATLPKPDGSDRRALRDAYLAKFPEVKILDMCWAARQHYSEWKRWLRNAVEDGSAPDRAFRAILISEKMPGEYRHQPRPKGWK